MYKDESQGIISIENIETAIHIIRGKKVLLDRDLAMLYGVKTKQLVQAVKRNIERFPEDFMFQLTKEEMKNLRSQFVTSSPISLRSQFVTLENNRASMKGRYSKYQLYAFTEQGVAMLSSVLRSPQAITVNIEIMRAFVRLRHVLASQKEIGKELLELRTFLLKHSHQTDREFKRVWQAIEKMMRPSPEDQHSIGFKLK
jgi:phage regulator Rha-like protein